MRRNLSITAATAALLLGTVFAAAQGPAPSGAPDAGTRPAQPQASPQGNQGGVNEAPAPRTQGQGGQAPRETQRDSTQPQQQAPREGQRDQKGATQDKAGQNNAAQGKAGAQGADVKLTTEQRTTIRTTVLEGGNRVSNVNFSIRVGTVVPRSVRLVAVPAPLIEIHPAWRNYVYFIVNEQIIIVEPSSHKIVAVLVV